MLATRRLPLPRVAARRPLGAPAVKLQQDIHQGIDSVVGGTVGVLAEGVGQKLGATKETLSASCADALQGRCLPAVTGLATHVVKVAGTSITGVLSSAQMKARTHVRYSSSLHHRPLPVVGRCCYCLHCAPAQHSDAHVGRAAVDT